jgi:hypothetical protein
LAETAAERARIARPLFFSIRYLIIITKSLTTLLRGSDCPGREAAGEVGELEGHPQKGGEDAAQSGAATG